MRVKNKISLQCEISILPFRPNVADEDLSNILFWYLPHPSGLFRNKISNDGNLRYKKTHSFRLKRFGSVNNQNEIPPLNKNNEDKRQGAFRLRKKDNGAFRLRKKSAELYDESFEDEV